MELLAKNIFVSYGRGDILKDVNICFKSGEWVSLIGANGAGKSTLLHAIVNWHFSKKSGEITLNGVKCTNSKSEIILVPFPSDLPDFLLGKELIEIIIRERGAQLIENWSNILAALDGDVWMDRPIGELSWGTKKKVCIASALCSGPNFILLDEAFDGLDAQSSSKIRNIFYDLIKENKIGILNASHAWESVFADSHRIYFLKNGSIIKELNQNEFADLKDEAKKIEQRVFEIFK